MISKNEIKKLDSIRNVNNVYVVLDSHTVLHNSESLLSSLYKKYGKQRVKLNTSLKNCEIPNSLENICSKSNDDFIENTA